MNPKIIDVKEATRLGPGSLPVKVLVVTWNAGTFGPFTTESSWEELNNGTLNTNLQAQARALSNMLPAS